MLILTIPNVIVTDLIIVKTNCDYIFIKTNFSGPYILMLLFL